MTFLPAEDLNPVSLKILSVAEKCGEELVSCNLEVLHGWSLGSLLRPPFMAGGVFFQGQMDGSNISTEIYTMETTYMHWPDWTKTQHTCSRHISDIKHTYFPVNLIWRIETLKSNLWKLAPFMAPQWEKNLHLKADFDLSKDQNCR